MERFRPSCWQACCLTCVTPSPWLLSPAWVWVLRARLSACFSVSHSNCCSFYTLHGEIWNCERPEWGLHVECWSWCVNTLKLMHHPHSCFACENWLDRKSQMCISRIFSLCLYYFNSLTVVVQRTCFFLDFLRYSPSHFSLYCTFKGIIEQFEKHACCSDDRKKSYWKCPHLVSIE